jgi:hypothetical protein
LNIKQEPLDIVEIQSLILFIMGESMPDKMDPLQKTRPTIFSQIRINIFTNLNWNQIIGGTLNDKSRDGRFIN